MPTKSVYLITLLLSLFSCTSEKKDNPLQKASFVKVVETNGKYDLTVNGEIFKVKGIGGSGNYKLLSESGGNSIRTWGTKNLDVMLDSAAKYDLMIAVGLDIEKELHGFDYNDEDAVKEQIERLKKEVLEFKDHPNVLCWVAGNEMNLLFNEEGGLKLVNPKTYTALAELVDFIHEVDPNHPVTTTFAGVMKTHIDLALTHCPNLDFISVQVYRDLEKIPGLVSTGVLDRPFMITEYGPIGHWEQPSTAWGREIEETSAEKAKSLTERIRIGIDEETSGLNIGTYAFLWGQKQERTPTWYGMFNKSGEATARVDVMTRYWTGDNPKNRAPLTDSLVLDGRRAEESVYLKNGEFYEANVFVRDLDGDELRYEWTLMKEVVEKSDGGAFEKEPATITLNVKESQGGKIIFQCPSETGDYRLFSYVNDGKGKVGNANFPFYVNP